MASSSENSENVSGGHRERRRHGRHMAIGPALISAEFVPGNFGLVIDLSADGLSVQPLAPMEPGTFTVIRCKLPPDNALVEISGEVVWCNKNKVTGIRFLDVSTRDQEIIRAALKHLHTAAQDAGVLRQETIDSVPPSSGEEEVNEPRAASLDIELNDLVRRAMSATSAKGSAIAVLAGNQFLCRASAGDAPGIGAVLQSDTGLTAECIREGRIVTCPDAQEDPRTNHEVCRQMGIASAVMVPVLDGPNVAAVLECFWASAFAYLDSDVTQLRDIAAELRELLLPSAQVPVPNAEPASSTGTSWCCDHFDDPSSESLVWKPYGEFGAADATVAQPPSDEPVEVAHAGELFHGNTPPKRPDVSVADQFLDPVQHWLNSRYVIVVAVASLLVAVSLGWYILRGASQSSQLQSAELGELPEATASAEISLDSVPLPPARGNRTVATSSSKNRENADSRVPRVVVTTLTVRPPERAGRFEPLRLVGEPVPGTQTSNAAGSQLRGAEGRRFSTPDTVQLTKAAKNSGSAVRRRGTVVLDVTVGKGGIVDDVKVVSGDRVLAEGAKRAASRWRYQPAAIDGTPIRANGRVIVSFDR